MKSLEELRTGTETIIDEEELDEGRSSVKSGATRWNINLDRYKSWVVSAEEEVRIAQEALKKVQKVLADHKKNKPKG